MNKTLQLVRWIRSLYRYLDAFATASNSRRVAFQVLLVPYYGVICSQSIGKFLEVEGGGGRGEVFLNITRPEGWFSVCNANFNKEWKIFLKDCDLLMILFLYVTIDSMIRCLPLVILNVTKAIKWKSIRGLATKRNDKTTFRHLFHVNVFLVISLVQFKRGMCENLSNISSMYVCD